MARRKTLQSLGLRGCPVEALVALPAEGVCTPRPVEHEKDADTGQNLDKASALSDLFSDKQLVALGDNAIPAEAPGSK